MPQFDDNTPLDSVVRSESKYLAQADIPTGGELTLTMNGFSQETTDGNDGKREILTLLNFTGGHKPMVIKPTNRDILKDLGYETAGDVRAHDITVWIDHSVRYAGRKVGGLRLKAPAGTEAGENQAQQDQQAQADDFSPDSDIPF